MLKTRLPQKNLHDVGRFKKKNFFVNKIHDYCMYINDQKRKTKKGRVKLLFDKLYTNFILC